MPNYQISTILYMKLSRNMDTNDDDNCDEDDDNCDDDDDN